MTEALANLHVAPDFESDPNILFVHRTLSDGEVYWIDSRVPNTLTVNATFRVAGKAAEFWHAETGLREPASYQIENGRTIVPLHLNGYESLFVVFHKPAVKPSRTLRPEVETRAETIPGPWDVAFQPNRGAHAKTSLRHSPPGAATPMLA